MEFKFKNIDIPESDPFLNDKLERKTEIENLSLLLRNISSPIVLSINSSWGTGKTTFVKMLHANLKNLEFNSIYFSAWETDFASDPLLAFLGEMNNGLESLFHDNESKREAWQKAKKAGIHIVKKGIPAIIKVATAGIIDSEKILEEESAKLLESFSKDLINNYLKEKDSIIIFKESVNKALTNKDGTKNKLFIFVDELDRCRPTYSIELLERIKHLLDIEGLVFILSMDKEQLSHSVKSLYGHDFESKGYLKRFIDIEYSLVKPNLDSFIKYNYDWFGFESFFEKRKKYSAFREDSEYLLDVFKFLASKHEMSLRDVEQLFARLNLVILSTPENVYIYPILLVFLLFAREYFPNEYSNYILKTTSPEEIISCLYTLISAEERKKSNECIWIEGMLIGAKRTHYDDYLGHSISIHKQTLENESANVYEQDYARRVIAISERPIEFSKMIDLKSLVSRIEILNNFEFGKEES